MREVNGSKKVLESDYLVPNATTSRNLDLQGYLKQIQYWETNKPNDYWHWQSLIDFVQYLQAEGDQWATGSLAENPNWVAFCPLAKKFSGMVWNWSDQSVNQLSTSGLQLPNQNPSVLSQPDTLTLPGLLRWWAFSALSKPILYQGPSPLPTCFRLCLRIVITLNFVWTYSGWKV